MTHRIAIAAIVTLLGAGLSGPARAAPPTVTPSPGYDQRLIDSSRRDLGARVLVPPPGHALPRPPRKAVRPRR
ncbi:MAG TPA: hypothetical protein VGC77_16115 [Rhodopseudomonas sp.]|uniref:hypothetical protein n=1 Tax=Rhodopseudomonas sp. TaxID=1078 RepID=UPI002EDACF2F